MPASLRLLRRASSLALLTTLLVLGACTGDRPELSDDVDRATTVAPDEATTTTTVPAPPPGAQVAQAKTDAIEIFDDATTTTPTTRFTGGIITATDATSAPGIPIVFLVKTPKASDADRYEVYLPVRPNGSTGWVSEDDVTVTSVTYRIEVAPKEHRLRLFDGDDMVLEAPIGVGTAELPTPGGIYYLKELLQPPNPDGAYGTYAYGLSGFSTKLTSFNGGSGVIGIHGTNDPGSIGSDVSHGCIRLNNEVIERLVNEIGLPLGTPVEILA